MAVPLPERDRVEGQAGAGPSSTGGPDRTLARRLVLDELFDLSLYRALRRIARRDLCDILDRLIPIEARHVAFWSDFFDLHPSALDASRRMKLAVIVTLCRLFGAPAIHLVLEAIEIYGVGTYLKVWQAYADGPLRDAVRGILEDEFRHEDVVVAGSAARRLNPERVRNIFLGPNDGLVEILGAVSGFFAAILAFLSGMSVRRRVVSNVIVIAVAVGITFAIGALTRRIWGLQL